jgi:hypothetical protein
MSGKLKKRNTDRVNGLIKAPEVSESIPAQKRKPVFSLHYLDKKYCVSECDKDEKAGLIDQLHILSNMTWQEIDSAPRHGIGREKIARNSIRGKFPDHIKHEENINICAFRFSGMKAMVGYRQENIFHIIWIDRDFTLYDH